MKVWIMWIPNSSDGESIALSPVPPVEKHGTLYFESKCGSFGCTRTNQYQIFFDYLFRNYVQYNISDKDVIEIEL